MSLFKTCNQPLRYKFNFKDSFLLLYPDPILKFQYDISPYNIYMKEIKQPRYCRIHSLAGEKNTTTRFPEAEKEEIQQRYKIKECSQLLVSGKFLREISIRAKNV